MTFSLFLAPSWLGVKYSGITCTGNVWESAQFGTAATPLNFVRFCQHCREQTTKGHGEFFYLFALLCFALQIIFSESIQ